MLIDWDSCKYVKDMVDPDTTRARQPDQTGTWQFISATRLKNFDGPHVRADDMESVFWVLLWLALKFGQHNIEPKKLSGKLADIFDKMNVAEDGEFGGDYKEFVLEKGVGRYLEVEFSPPVLQEVLEEMCACFTVRTELPPPELGAKPKYRRDPRQLVAYEVLLDWYNRSVDQLKNAAYIREKIENALAREAEWPVFGDGPRQHDVPMAPGADASYKRSANRESAMEAQEAAKYTPAQNAKRSEKKRSRDTVGGRGKRVRVARGAAPSTVEEADVEPSEIEFAAELTDATTSTDPHSWGP